MKNNLLKKNSILETNPAELLGKIGSLGFFMPPAAEDSPVSSLSASNIMMYQSTPLESLFMNEDTFKQALNQGQITKVNLSQGQVSGATRIACINNELLLCCENAVLLFANNAGDAYSFQKKLFGRIS